jgi:GntR family transcriptional regulator
VATNPQTPVKFSLDTRSLYMRVEEALDELIKGCQAGDRLPSEADLAHQMSISRATLREVLRTFDERGLIVRKHGLGTFVTGKQTLIESGLEVLESLDSMAERLGYQISIRDVTMQQQAADAVIAKQLDIPVGDPVLVITRTRIKDDFILAYMYDAIAVSLIDQEDLQKQFAGSVLDYLRSRMPAALPFWAQANLQAVPAPTDLQKKMKVPQGTALLLLEEKLFSADNRVINYSQNYYLTSHFLFHIIRRSL